MDEVNNSFSAVFDTVQIQWGFAVLLIGISFLIAASLIEKNETLQD
jgi:hypothetical protein